MVSGDRAMPSTDEAAKAPQNSADNLLIKTWLHNRGANTRRAYESDVRAFLAHVGKPLAQVTASDLQSWYDSLKGSDATRRRKLMAVKSLLSYGAAMEMLPRDVGPAVRVPKMRDSLHERILTQEQVRDLIDGETDPRRRTMLRVLYATGLRISELCAVRWKDLKRRQQGGVAHVFGKGGKNRTVEIPAKVWKEIVALRVDDRPEAPMVPGHDGGPLSVDAVHRSVKRAAKRAGLPEQVSAHWLRHAYASHMQDNGAPAHVVQQQLGHTSLATTTRYSHAREGAGAGKFLDL
ncbi:tyrosine-type recombinase/integrase [Komagataeibacter saccharivorans]|uniref:tyrosine-type recombinase/integrase n=1 Tax=Komagataeibacter saccharivorans TaxID=265959 RepID=UPI0039E78DA4